MWLQLSEISGICGDEQDVDNVDPFVILTSWLLNVFLVYRMLMVASKTSLIRVRNSMSRIAFFAFTHFI